MSVYTKQGDEGKSYLYADENSAQIAKSDIRFSFLGDIDELSSHLGLIKSQLADRDERLFMEDIQKKLSSMLASIHQGEAFLSVDYNTEPFEKKIDYMQSICETKGFIIPGSTTLSAEIDIARTVARRTERNLCAVSERYAINQQAEQLKYLNRLSDFLFALARHIEYVYSIKSTVKKFNGGFENMSEKNAELTLEICKNMMEQIENSAKKISLAVAIAFCDKSGNPILAGAMKDTLLVSFECAMKKAYTATALKMPTDKAQQLAVPGQIFYGLTSLDKIMLIPGGIPIYCNNEIIGGVGVSGGDDVTDVELARLGSEFFL